MYDTHDRKQIMSGLEGLTFDDWQHYYSDTEVQVVAKEALALLKEQQKLIDDITARRMNNGAFD